MKYLLFVMLILIFISTLSYSSTSMAHLFDVEINISGHITGSIKKAIITIPIPQQRLYIRSSHPYVLEKDDQGNEMAVIHVDDNDYWISFRIRNYAVNCSTKIPDEIVKAVISANTYIKYDSSLENVTKPASWVIENRRGTCDEYSNLLVWNLSKLGYKTRFVSGYAYSSPLDNRLTRHSWVQVLINNTWVNLDPTWGEICFLDATHIPVGIFDKPLISEKIEYEGNIRDWKTYEKFTIHNISYFKPEISAEYIGGKDGLLKIKSSFPCMSYNIRLVSCIEDGKDVLIFDPQEAKGFSCSGFDGIFLYYGKNEGICPVNIYFNGLETKTVLIDLRDQYGPNLFSKPFWKVGEKINISSDGEIYYAGKKVSNQITVLPGKHLICSSLNGVTCNEIWGINETPNFTIQKPGILWSRWYIINGEKHKIQTKKFEVFWKGKKVVMTRPSGLFGKILEKILEFL